MMPDVKYLGGTLDRAQLQQRHNHEDTVSSVKFHMYKGNTEIPHQTGMHNTSTIPVYTMP